MSASLVGSEMCIRDSRGRHPVPLRGWDGRATRAHCCKRMAEASTLLPACMTLLVKGRSLCASCRARQ
eukprot:11205541-Alexandrium_andersonii.AAC.1